MSRATVLCLDGGRSGCRARLRLPSGAAVEASGPPLPYLRAPAAVQAVVDALDGALSGLPSTRADVVVAGLAGVAEQLELAPALAQALAGRSGAGRVVVTGDLVTAHAGALGGGAGVVVVAGTGAAALAVAADGRSARADGWGYLLGDEGSGFWIGRAGLAAALADRDGRGGSAALRRRAEATFGALERLPEAVYGGGQPVRTVAGFAPQVAAAARAGDRLARRLWQEAGRRLAAAAAAAAGAVEVGHPPTGAVPASYSGRLFDAGELLLDPLRRELARLAPDLRLRAPAGGPLDGAETLAACPSLPASIAHVHDTRP